MKNIPKNLKLRTIENQKEIVTVIASSTTEEIIKDIGDDLFLVYIVDESYDASANEKCLSYYFT